MIKASLLFFLTIVLFSCTNFKKESPISGIFRIESKNIINPMMDTFYSDQNQVKIYTDEFYAYTNLKGDSTAAFGIGFYEANEDQLLEHNIYSTIALDTPQVFKLKIEKAEQRYKQTIDHLKVNGVPTTLVEQYVSIPAVGTSSIDGIWKLNKYFKVIGEDTVYEKRVQYKIFHKGYFMFVQDMHSNTDSTKLRSGFGFGVFELNNDKISETNLFSTYPSIIDKKLTVDVYFDGKDDFYQIMPSDVNGLKSVELYTRVKSSSVKK
jgi:hypothetical protein